MFLSLHLSRIAGGKPATVINSVDRRSTLADLLVDLVLGVAKFFCQGLETVGFFPDVKVLSLEVLDQGDLGDALLVRVDHNTRDFRQGRQALTLSIDARRR